MYKRNPLKKGASVGFVGPFCKAIQSAPCGWVASAFPSVVVGVQVVVVVRVVVVVVVVAVAVAAVAHIAVAFFA